MNYFEVACDLARNQAREVAKLPTLDPAEHAALEHEAGRSLTNEEAQEFVKQFYCCREHAQSRLRCEKSR